MNILADSTLPGLHEAFPKPFHLSTYHHPDEIALLLPGQDVLFCRSTLQVTPSLLSKHQLHYVATASSGTDHLDVLWLQSQNIQVIDAKGSNASAVADYVVACLAYLEQQHLIGGKKAGIIGFGKVGTQVAQRLHAAQFQILTCDPLKAAQEPEVFQTCSLEDLYQTDLLCIHASLHKNNPHPSTNLIDKNFLLHLKPGCILINASRGGIVNEHDLIKSKTPLIYCTDVYLNEPAIDQRIVDKALLCTPHIAGHSLEAKYAAVALVSEQLHQRANLSIPPFAAPKLPKILCLKKEALWYERILKIYNPLMETLQLKQTKDKDSAFLHWRKNHTTRHDFSLYFSDDGIPYY